MLLLHLEQLPYLHICFATSQLVFTVFCGFVMVGAFLGVSSLNVGPQERKYPCGSHSCEENPEKKRNILGAILRLAEKQTNGKYEHFFLNEIIFKSPSW